MFPTLSKTRRALLGCAMALGASAQEPVARVPRAGDRELVFRVRVVDPSGAAVPDAFVALRPVVRGNVEPKAGDLRLGQDWRRSDVRTNTAGWARIEADGPGPWWVGAGAPPDYAHGFHGPTPPGREVTIVLPPLPRDRVLAGVLLQPDGAPLERAQVVFVHDDRGQRRHVRALTGGDGGFILVADGSQATGALYASALHYGFGSTAIEHIETGTGNLELQLGPPRPLRVEGTDQNGRVFDCGARFSWLLAGHEYEDARWPKAARGEPLHYELPAVPFIVDVLGGEDHDSVRLGPLDPDDVGSKIEVRMHAHARLRGRVLHEGEPVPLAYVNLRGVGPPPTLDVERRFSGPGQGRWLNADAQGVFDLPLLRAGSYELVASRREVGQGSLGPIELDPERPPELVIDIARNTGQIAGRVFLPPGHDVSEIWLAATPGHRPIGLDAYMPLQADGTYLLTELPAGTVTVLIRRCFEIARPDSPTTGRWISMSHGPTRAPEWLTIEPTFEVEVRSDETVRLDIDLTRPARCRLDGKITLDGAPPPAEAQEPGMYEEPDPRARLDRGVYARYVSRSELGEDGSFTLQADEPGEYRLWLEVPTAGQDDWVLFDRVRLEPGATHWERDIPTGGLRLLLPENGPPAAPSSDSLRWAGPGHLRIFLRRHRLKNETVEEAFFPVVPAGTLQLYDDSGGTRRVLLEAEVGARAVTAVERP